VRIAILGVGLIGGSVGLAARGRLGAHVVGYDVDEAGLDAALQAGAIDERGALADVVARADIAIICAPVGKIVATARAVLEHAGEDTVVTDVGSAKSDVVAAIEDRRFIGGHPLAGAETAGVGGARADLFDGAPWYLTPRADTSGVLFERLARFVAALGARPQAIDAATHDRLMASVSHLPHVIANVLVAQAARALGDDDGTLPATGPSFRDATRVAGANTAMWTDIYLANREALVDQLDETVRRLLAFRESLVAADAAAIAAWNEGARHDRQGLLAVGLAGGDGPVRELRVAVPNRPGVVAELALSLGRAGININDMTLSPAADGRTGEVALWVAAEHAGRATELVAALGLTVEEVP